ncbi:MAG: DegT/DnrJ/EryC1/StrS family aminotransferase [Candidatus Competibacter sp.]|nr:DegT/DnrJ/EryC1/StrS family aminotransferase [Candidatus Competibacter sp.]MDG4606907.1 DegT/DnrJ/EryC1/StrS family aminotransferase [Candidatus Contendobacter sp.]HRD48348.1 DegT/DnrJ/EryC1/StrS family aminotransferase [Candidatus Contendobacter sp.]
MPSKAQPSFSFQDIRSRAGQTLRTLPSAESLVYTYNGRGAIYHTLRALRKHGSDTVLLPAFHCVVLVEAVLRAGYKVRFYGIGEDLQPDMESFLSQLSSDVACAVVIDYFGFPASLHEAYSACQAAGCILFQDSSHSFYRTDPLELTGEIGDLAIFSFWKIIPSYAGGGIRINNSTLSVQPVFGKRPWRETMVQIKRMFEEAATADANSALSHAYLWLESARLRLKGVQPIFVDAENNAPSHAQAYHFGFESAVSRLPWISKWVIDCADLEVIAKQRQRNSRIALERLSGHDTIHPVWLELPDRIVPYALPVRMPDRSHHDYRLRRQGVPLFTFGETLHPLLSNQEASHSPIRKTAERLAREVLCLSIDQKLSGETIVRYCDIIEYYLAINA